MSFLNPVNEPVLRFSSTDASAPQINYNARTAGDVKTVLKACLVTGYGAKASAGWTSVNETATVIEFISPSAVMSDYRLGIDDTSVSSTTWSYYYQEVKKIPLKNILNRGFENINKTSPKNGWQLLVTGLAIIFIEHVYSTSNSEVVSRITYFGQLKSLLITNTGENIAFWNIGWGAASQDPSKFFESPLTNTYFMLSNMSINGFSSANLARLATNTTQADYLVTSVDMYSPLFLVSDKKDVVAQQPAVLTRIHANTSTVLGMYEQTIEGRPYLYVASSYSFNSDSGVFVYARGFSIPLDYWGF